MKRFLLFSLLLCAAFSTTQIRAQGGGGLTSACGIYDILVQGIEPVGNNASGQCVVNFDLAFTLAENSGNKHIFLQTYIGSVTLNGVAQANPNPYPNYFNCQNGQTSQKKPPLAADAGNPLLNIAINNFGDQPVFQSYVPDPTLAIKGTSASTTIKKVTLANGDTRFLIDNIQVILPYGCASGYQYTFITDVFSSQATQANTLHCVNCGITTTGGVVNVAGVLNCDMVTATITNNSASPLSVTYELYADNGDGILATEGSEDVLLTSATVNIAGMGSHPVNYTVTPQYVGRDVFFVVNIGGARRAQLLPTIECSPLPVAFGSFSANRNRDNVLLSWQTETEQNSRGFEIQRDMGNNKWQSIAFIPTKAPLGNSSSVLQYEFNDMNTSRNISHYRLRQVDIDGQMMMSPVRAVRGVGQPTGIIVYPNPAANGQVNVLFENDRDKLDLFLTDMSGRVWKQWNNYADNTLNIANLTPGMYILKIVNRGTGESEAKKIMVNNR